MNSLIMDFYGLTTSFAYFQQDKQNTIAYFDVYYRRAPDGAPFAIANGISEIIDFIFNFQFSKSDIEYLKSTKQFTESYLNYLSKLRFTGDVWAVADGTVIFPNEPVITIRAPIIEAQLLETYILLKFNHASLITTKANRIVRSAKNIPVLEFGVRRAHGKDSAIHGALYAYEAGTIGTTCTEAGKEFGIKEYGTMSHSYVQCYESEYEAFVAFAKTYPSNCILLIDTYNTIESGLENAIKVHKKILAPMGKKLCAIRIDSGDLSYLAKECRRRLDEAQMFDTKIILSNSLDEFVIESIIAQNTPADLFAVGEKLITANSNPLFGGVYKLVAIENNGKIVPKIKISDNLEKITTPGFKNIFRIYDNKGKIISDVVCLKSEPKPSGNIELKDPDRPWLIKKLTNVKVRELRYKFIQKGKRIFRSMTPNDVRKNINLEIATLPPEALRLHHPQTITVNISQRLTEIKDRLLIKRYR